MKKLLFTFIMMLSISLNAQNYVTIYGKLGAQDVNIQIVNTQYGTSSDAKGCYSLKVDKSWPEIKLQYSCLGYQDTSIIIAPKKFKADSVELSFKMRPIYYMLDEVGISDDKVIRYREQEYAMIDFEIIKDKFFILQRELKSNRACRILLADMMFNILDTIEISRNIIAEELFEDCFGEGHIIGQDSVYQIIADGNTYSVAFPSEKNHFIQVMGNCLFVTDKWLYTKKVDATGYNEIYYRIDRKDRKTESFFKSIDIQSHRNYAYEYKFHEDYPKRLKMIYHGPTPEDWGVFLRNVWLHPKSSYLGIVGDTLYYFNHVKSIIEAYDEDLNLLTTSKITYPETEDFWRFKIYQDKAFGRFYTVFGDKLNEIDVKSGKTYPKATVNQHLNQKVIIYKGAAYTLKRRMDSGNIWVSYIDRIKL